MTTFSLNQTNGSVASLTTVTTRAPNPGAIARRSPMVQIAAMRPNGQTLYVTEPLAQTITAYTLNS